MWNWVKTISRVFSGATSEQEKKAMNALIDEKVCREMEYSIRGTKIDLTDDQLEQHLRKSVTAEFKRLRSERDPVFMELLHLKMKEESELPTSKPGSTVTSGASETSSVNQEITQGASMQATPSQTAIKTRKDANPQKTEMHPIASLIIPIKAPNSGAPAPNSGAPFSIFTSIATVLVNLTETLTKKSPEEEGAKKQLTDAKPQTDKIINNKSTKPPEDIKASARFNPGEENTRDGPIQDKRSEWKKKKDEFMKKAKAEAVKTSQAIEASKQSTQQAKEAFLSSHATFGFENPDLHARDHNLSQKIALATSETSHKSAPIGGYADRETDNNKVSEGKEESLSLTERLYNIINPWDPNVDPTYGKAEPKPLKPLSPENFNAQSARTHIHHPITSTSALEPAQESQKTNPINSIGPQTMKARVLTSVQASESRGQNQPGKEGGVKFALAPKTGGGETKAKESATKPKVRFADNTKKGSNHVRVRRTNNAGQGKENVPNQR